MCIGKPINARLAGSDLADRTNLVNLVTLSSLRCVWTLKALYLVRQAAASVNVAFAAHRPTVGAAIAGRQAMPLMPWLTGKKPDDEHACGSNCVNGNDS